MVTMLLAAADAAELLPLSLSLDLQFLILVNQSSSYISRALFIKDMCWLVSLLNVMQPTGHPFYGDVVDVKQSPDENLHPSYVLWHDLQHLLYYIGIGDAVIKET